MASQVKERIQVFSDDQIIAMAKEILLKRVKKISLKPLTSPAVLIDFLTVQLCDKTHEQFGVLFLDNRHNVIDIRELFRGTIDGAAAYPREVLKDALDCGAAAVIFYHNHPSGDVSPSRSDDIITNKLKEALEVVDIRVLDHIVVSASDYYSYAEHGRL